MTIQIGKNGLTQSVLEEISYQLKDKKEVKVKMLKSLSGSMEREEIRDAFNSIIHYVQSNNINAVLESKKGNTAMIKVKRKDSK